MSRRRVSDANNDLRMLAKSKGVRLWQIADYMNVSEATFLRWMRFPFDENKKEIFIKAVADIEELNKEYLRRNDCDYL